MQIAIYYYVLHRYSVYTYLYAIILSSHIVYIYAITTPLVYIIPRTAVRVIIQYPNTYSRVYSLLVCITAYTLYSKCIVHCYCDWLDWPNSMQREIAELSAFRQPQIIALASYYGISIFIQTTILLKYAYLENSFLFPIQFNKYRTRGVYSTILLHVKSLDTAVDYRQDTTAGMKSES